MQIRLLSKQETRRYLERVFDGCLENSALEDCDEYVVSRVLQCLLKDNMGFNKYSGEEDECLHMKEIALNMFGCENVEPIECVKSVLSRIFTFFIIDASCEHSIKSVKAVCMYALTDV